MIVSETQLNMEEGTVFLFSTENMPQFFNKVKKVFSRSQI